MRKKWPECQDCGGKRCNPVGLVRWPEDDDPYIGINCLRDRFKKLQTRLADIERALNGGGCTLSGPGRGDCEHEIGLPGKSIPGQHDGEDDTVDVYGKPNEWCWSCWKSYRISMLEQKIERIRNYLDAFRKWADEDQVMVVDENNMVKSSPEFKKKQSETLIAIHKEVYEE